jgi:hypothetical protein
MNLPRAALAAVLLLLAAVLPPPARAASVVDGAWHALNDVFSPRQKMASACHVGADGNFTMHVFGGRDARKRTRDDMFEYSHGTGVWQQVHTSGAVPATEAPVMGVVNGTKLVMFGGTQAGAASNAAFLYDEATHIWTELQYQAALRPTPRQRMRAWVVSDRYLVVFGGVSERSVLNEVWALDTELGVWALWHDGAGTAPSARFDACCTTVPGTNETLCFGGTDAHGDRQDMWVFYSDTRTWADVTPATGSPSARRLAHCGFESGEFAIWGGWDSTAGAFVADTNLTLFDPTTETYRKVSQGQHVSPMHSGTMCSAGGEAHMVGGVLHDRSLTNAHLRLAADQLALVSALTLAPAERAGHSAVAIAKQMYVLFGADGATHYNDVWRLDTVTLVWESVLEGANSRGHVAQLTPAARKGACVGARGALIFVYGGTNARGEELSDLWMLNTRRNVWAPQVAEGESPGPRVNHGCAFIDNSFILGMGKSYGADTADWFAYNLLYQRWGPLVRHGIAPEARHAFAIKAINHTHLHVGLGIGAHTHRDWFTIGNFSQTPRIGDVASATFLPLVAAMPAAGQERRYARGEAAAAGTGERVIVCGGGISNTFPVAAAANCYQYDGAGESVAPMPNPRTSSTYASAVIIENRYILFGGRLSSDTLKLHMYRSATEYFEFNTATATCAAGQAVDAACFQCALGSTNPSCTPAAAGSYSKLPYAAPTPCDEGHYSHVEGAASALFCVKCPQGTYAAGTGNTACVACSVPEMCTMGERIDVPVPSNDTADEVFIDDAETDQPKKFHGNDYPLSIVLAVFVTIGVAAAVVAALAALGVIRIRSVDTFEGDHTDYAEIGQPVLKRQTRFGGVFTLVAYGAVVVLCTLHVLEYFYNTVVEVKGDVPLPVLQSMFGNVTVQNDMFVLASVTGPLRDNVVGGHAETTLAAVCVVNGTKDTCVGSVAFVTTGAAYALPQHLGGITTSCVIDAALYACNMTAAVRGMTLHQDETAQLQFLFSPALSAEVIRARVVSVTGLVTQHVGEDGEVVIGGGPDGRSVFALDVAPLLPFDTVFSGFPATKVFMRMTPTFFVTPTNLVDWPWGGGKTLRSTGYHVTERIDASPGHEVDELLFDQYFGVPFVVELYSDSTSLLISHRHRQTLIELVSQLLGSATGLVGVALVVVKLVDKAVVKLKARRRAARVEDGVEEGLTSDASDSQCEAILREKAARRRRKKVLRREHELDDAAPVMAPGPTYLLPPTVSCITPTEASETPPSDRATAVVIETDGAGDTVPRPRPRRQARRRAAQPNGVEPFPSASTFGAESEPSSEWN